MAKKSNSPKKEKVLYLAIGLDNGIWSTSGVLSPSIKTAVDDLEFSYTCSDIMVIKVLGLKPADKTKTYPVIEVKV